MRVFRWKGIIPLSLILLLLLAAWAVFGERIIRSTIQEAATKALGAEFDLDAVKIHSFASTVELKGIQLADPFDRNRNLFEIKQIRVELEPKPLLQKKLVVRSLTIADVSTNTRRAKPAAPASGGGFAPRALAEVQRFASQFNVPLMSLVPIDTLKAIVLDPTKLQSVQAALALARETDSVKQRVETAYNGLRVQETLDSSRALITRLEGTNVRSLGIDGARKAVADIRAAVARVDSTKARVQALVTTVRSGADTLQARLTIIDERRRDDYAFAKGLLHMPSVDAPDIGAALFGKVTIDKFQQAVYWATLARQYAPPGLLPRETPGPKRRRMAGTTVTFVTPQSYPRFLMRRANVNITVNGGAASGTYAFAASDVTTDQAIVGKPTLFALRHAATGSDVESVRIIGYMDHRARPREIVNVEASGVRLPSFSMPVLPYSLEAGRGTSELRFALDGEQLTGRWNVRSSSVKWTPDAARSRPLNTFESLVARVLTGISELEINAEVSGTMKAPRLSVRSNLDRQVADRLRAVAGEEIARMQARVRAQVDRLVDEKTAPIKARVAELRADGERRLAEARVRLDDEKRRLEDRLKSLGGNMIPLPRIPSD